MINEEALIKFLEGERYLLSDNDNTEAYEKAHQYELGNNRMIEKTIDWIYSAMKLRDSETSSCILKKGNE